MVAKQSKAVAAKSANGAAAPKGQTEASLEEARRKFTRIDAFEGPFEFLALDTPCNVMWDGVMYQSAQHALLAAQYPEAAQDISCVETLTEAKKAAQEVPECSDWSSVRLKAMEKIQRDKFRRSADYQQQLKETGTRELAWDNDDDGFWGTIKGAGQNQLGNVLMNVRSSIQDDTEFDTWLHVCCELEDSVMNCPPVELLEQKLSAEGATEEKKLHRLSGKSLYKFGKLPTNDVVALHQSLSREHAMILHTKSKDAASSHGLAIMDLGSKAGTKVSERSLKHPFMVEPLRNGDVVRLGASTRGYYVKINLAWQIEQLEEEERRLMKEVRNIDNDAENPIEAAKRAVREESTVFVGNLDYETEKADLLGLFQDCGKVEEVRFPGPPGTMKAVKGICFVVFESGMAARRACGLTGQLFKERKVKVSPAAEGKKHDENPGRKGGVSGDWRLDKVELAELPAAREAAHGHDGASRERRAAPAEDSQGNDRRRARSPPRRSPPRRSPPRRRSRSASRRGRPQRERGRRRGSSESRSNVPKRRRTQADRSKSRDPSPSPCSIASAPRKKHREKHAERQRSPKRARRG
mmetsp:Transcript_27029/g.62448  ORF Transcript_27029/g.62448 Transcript_27029/m.62448 type:complete len:581 (+) Transcript_27029:73-1815(+)